MPRLVATGARNITFPVKDDNGVMERLEFTPLIPVVVKKKQLEALEECHLFEKLMGTGEIKEIKKGDKDFLTKEEALELAKKDVKDDDDSGKGGKGGKGGGS